MSDSRLLHVRRLGRATVLVFSLLLLAVAACRSKPLPEPDSPDALVYVARCGVCHEPYHPSGLTPKMWEAMVGLMEGGPMKKAGMPALQPAEQSSILAYLTKHAAQH